MTISKTDSGNATAGRYSNGDDPRSALDAVTAAAELARTGRHAEAIETCSKALAHLGDGAAIRFDLLDARAESHIALGQFEHATVDSEEMLRLAGSAKTQARQAQALIRLAVLQMRRGELQQGLASATAATRAARQARRRPLLARSLLCLGEAQYRAGFSADAAVTLRKGIKMLEAAGRAAGSGRSHAVLALIAQREGRVDEARAEATTAYQLCAAAGDQCGVGSALNALAQSETDLTEHIRYFQRAADAFELAGYMERRNVVRANLGLAYGRLGLYSNAARLQREVIVAARKMGAKAGLAYALDNLLSAEFELGMLADASRNLQEFAELVATLGDPIKDSALIARRAELALAQGNAPEAVRYYMSTVELAERTKSADDVIYLSLLSGANLAAGDRPAALAATTRATDLHRARSFPQLDGFSSQELWWRHAQALAANGDTEASFAALEKAYDFLLEGIRNLRDDGLRRNYLNKVTANREILEEWLTAGKQRKLPETRLTAHLAIESNVREPFRRLADSGLRMNALHTPAAIRTFLVEEAVELSGGERVLLVLEHNGGREVAASLLPRGETPAEVLESILPYLDRTWLTRKAQLHFTPNTGAARKQRSQIVAPLIAQNGLLGYLYAEVSGFFGRFGDTDRDMMELLANQAAVALDNARWSIALEQKVDERTTALTASNANLAQRNTELGIINSIQQGLAAELDFQAIVDLVGDKLREVFKTPGLGITWYDEKAHLIHHLYIVEHGKRLVVGPRPPNPGGMFETMRQTRRPIVFSGAETEPHAPAFPGTNLSKTFVSVPIIRSDRVLGDISLENFERENAFGEPELRVLTTIAASLGIALENARLFGEVRQSRAEAEESRAAAEEANQAKSTFLANMSHELRTPLNAIIGVTEMLQEDAKEFNREDEFEPLERVVRAGRHLLALINDILDLSKIEAGKMELHLESFSLRAVLDDVKNTIATLAQMNGNRVAVECAPDVGIIVADQTRLRQALLNLGSNATKFTEKGTVTFSARRSTEQGRDWVMLAVADTGIGLTPEQIGRLFQEFVQADSSTTRKYGGTGLGLVISRRFCQLMGGDITVTSAAGHGSTFTIRLPADVAAVQPVAALRPALVQSLPTQSGTQDPNLIHTANAESAKT